MRNAIINISLRQQRKETFSVAEINTYATNKEKVSALQQLEIDGPSMADAIAFW